MRRTKALCTGGLLALLTVAPATMSAQEATTTVTNATGTISQLNYGENGAIEGFLIGTNILLTFPRTVTGGIGTLGAVGNSITYSGTAETNSAGFENVRITSFTNNTTKATYTGNTSTTPTSTAYGPTSGTIKQINYDSNGLVDGFLFTPSGNTASILVVTGSGASTTLKPLLTTGATVSVTGTTPSATTTANCVTGTTLTVVHASSLIIGGQTIVLAGTGVGGGRGFGHR